MRINTVAIRNFRAIAALELSDLADVVVIAGPNGCGKTQIFHAIRLLKSIYGGYQPNEWQQWFGEFQIDVNRNPHQLAALFRDPTKPIFVRVALALSEAEKTYLQGNIRELLRPIVWREIAPQSAGSTFGGGTPVAQAQRQFGQAVDERVEATAEAVLASLGAEIHVGEVEITPDLKVRPQENRTLEFLFTVYDPEHIGVIDYHGAHRNYTREQLGGINLNIASTEDRVRQHALYNSHQKYANVKSELGAGYVRDLISAEAGLGNDDATLLETLQDLFGTFFPGKTFLGPSPRRDGSLAFPVRLKTGAEHDIDDLSSGEKEVLFGYLRLRKSAPKNSILLLDEPELHLNPALLRGLPQFYHRALGRALNNQLWLVTHSDALLREAVGQNEFSVFHMQASDLAEPQGNQVRELSVGEGLERAVVDLVGDLASYRPGAKVVIFEGGGRTEFDVYVTMSLFPELRDAVTPISGGDRRRVRELHDLLEKAAAAGDLPAQFFSIVDRDATPPDSTTRSFAWDRYHIENYLLEPEFIRRALAEVRRTLEEDEIVHCLKECAEETLPDLVRHELERDAQLALVGAVATNADRGVKNVAPSLVRALIASQERVRELLEGPLSLDELKKKELITKNRLKQDLEGDAWLSTFRGREVLKRFIDRVGSPVGYDVFCNLVLARMRDAGFQPTGMAVVVRSILDG